MSSEKLIFYISNNSIRIEGKIESVLYKKFKKALGYRPEGAFFQMKKSGGDKWGWDGVISTVCYSRHYCKCPVKKDGTHFPSGLYGKAKNFFIEHSVPCQMIDTRIPVSRSLDLTMSPDFEIRPYQQEITEKSVIAQRGIIRCPTGSGKTSISAAIIAKLGVSPFIFYVPSIDLLTQARNEISKFVLQNGKHLKVGTIGDGVCDVQDINVMTVQTAVRSLGEKYVKFDDEDVIEKNEVLEGKRAEIKDLIMSAKGYISDECQVWAAESCQIISDYSLSAFYRWGQSGTPFRDKGDDILIDACFGKVVADVTSSFLIKQGYLVRPHIYFVNIKHPKYNVSSYQKIYEQGIANNPYRNNCIASIAKKFASQGHTVLVLCQHISHGKILHSLMENSIFLHGVHSGAQREKHLNKMRAQDAPITVATVIFDQGIDCKPLDTLILAGGGKSKVRALQRVGRTLRPYPGKTHSIVVDFNDQCKYLSVHSKKRRKIYSTEPEFEIEDIEIAQND